MNSVVFFLAGKRLQRSWKVNLWVHPRHPSADAEMLIKDVHEQERPSKKMRRKNVRCGPG